MSTSFYHQHGTRSELDDAIGATADHSLVQRRMAGCSNYQQVSAEFVCKFDNPADRMPG